MIPLKPPKKFEVAVIRALLELYPIRRVASDLDEPGRTNAFQIIHKGLGFRV